jgi:xanthine dehydrogenase small subunit
MFDLPATRMATGPVVQALQDLRAQDAGFDYAAPNAAQGGRVDSFHAPRTLDELAAACEAKPRARLLAGSTDVGLWVTKQFRDLGDIV